MNVSNGRTRWISEDTWLGADPPNLPELVAASRRGGTRPRTGDLALVAELKSTERQLYRIDLELWEIAWDRMHRLRKLGLRAPSPPLPRPSQYEQHKRLASRISATASTTGGASPAGATRSGSVHYRPAIGSVVGIY